MSTLGGLSAETWDPIASVLEQCPSRHWATLYGSRAMGRQRPGSDIDLAFSSLEDCSAALADAFEKLEIPDKVDGRWDPLGESFASGPAPAHRQRGDSADDRPSHSQPFNNGHSQWCG